MRPAKAAQAQAKAVVCLGAGGAVVQAGCRRLLLLLLCAPVPAACHFYCPLRPAPPTRPTCLPHLPACPPAEGNLHGILVGRECLPDGIMYASRETHYSIFKAARMYRMDACKVGRYSLMGAQGGALVWLGWVGWRAAGRMPWVGGWVGGAAPAATAVEAAVQPACNQASLSPCCTLYRACTACRWAPSRAARLITRSSSSSWRPTLLAPPSSTSTSAPPSRGRWMTWTASSTSSRWVGGWVVGWVARVGGWAVGKWG